MLRKRTLLYLLVVWIFINNGPADAQDETALFAATAPDALIVLDLSKSMDWTPAGERMYTLDGQSCDSSNNPFYSDSASGHTKACSIDVYETVPKYGNAACSGPFYRNSGSGHTTDCRRVMIARRALFDILDDNDSNTINSQDEGSLGIRIGYMRFYDCGDDDTGGDYNNGCNRLRAAMGTSYKTLWEGNSGWSGINGTTTSSGGTPIVSALSEAKLYLDAHKATDPAAACRQKFAILITDGADTYACGGNGGEDQEDQYKRRRATVAKAKALADAGYKVFIVGFGADMPHWLRNTLNWAAYYGGTDNPLIANSGDPSAYNPDLVLNCQESSTNYHNIGGDGYHYHATANDPGEIELVGYASLASNPDDLTTALKQAINLIREATYSFSISSVASTRTQDENNIYEPSFQPVNGDPFWLGHLKKYNLNSNGGLGSLAWDAGTILQSASASSRNIYTYKEGVRTAYTVSNLSNQILGVATNAEREAIVGYIRGESAYNRDHWKLGDIFHSNPITIGTPSYFFVDQRDANKAFEQFRLNHQRSSANGKRIIVTGANDGQFHAFKTQDGSELWSLIPPNLLPKLKYIAHSSHPTALGHQYFVDGAISVVDVWLGSGDGTAKSAGDWKTLLVFGEGKGVRDVDNNPSFLWSSSSSCDQGFSARYSSTTPYYCGYYALDVTDTSLAYPNLLWRLNPDSLRASYLGEPWSKMKMGKVKVNGSEKWVGFIGGGFNTVQDPSDDRGKGFFVIDLSNGDILWSYTKYDASGMDYSIPASPAIADDDNDGFVDTAYVGDLGGNIWKFTFCKNTDGNSCNTGHWSGGMLFQASSGIVRPIFSTPTVAKDASNIWVFWGTGDKTNPTVLNTQEKFFGLKDGNPTMPYGIDDLENIGEAGTYPNSPAKHGWYFNFSVLGEKMLADPTVFGGMVLFTSYTPPSGTGDPCSQGGVGKLYAIAMQLMVINEQTFAVGKGLFSVNGTRSITLGTGIPTAPVVSQKPANGTTDIYVSVSGGGGQDTQMRSSSEFPESPLTDRLQRTGASAKLIHWRDRRL